MQHYDLIGDIHGHAHELVKLLEHLGYTPSETGHQHEVRKVIFLGDFVDRGEHLRQHRKVLDIVIKMVANEHALAVMGNHEFNALAYHTVHDGENLRPHTLTMRNHQPAVALSVRQPVYDAITAGNCPQDRAVAESLWTGLPEEYTKDETNKATHHLMVARLVQS